MRFPYGKIVRQDEIGKRVTLTVEFRQDQLDEMNALAADIKNGDPVAWPHARRWQILEGSREYRAGGATAIVWMERLTE